LRNVLLRPLSRVQLVSGKFLALLAALVTSYAVLAGVLHLTAWITRGFGDAVEILPNGQPFVMTAAAELVPDLGWTWLAPVAALARVGASGQVRAQRRLRHHRVSEVPRAIDARLPALEGDAEDAAEPADILAQRQHRRIGLHLVADRRRDDGRQRAIGTLYDAVSFVFTRSHYFESDAGCATQVYQTCGGFTLELPPCIDS
jgi:hypothetical protein